MRYGSVCSGIEAASVAWEPLGWKPSFFSEIEKFPRAVLSHHYPDVPLHGDFTTIGADEYGPIELLVGGTPCQSFSVAGLRGGLDDDRGNLALEYLRLAQRKRPRWLVWENVPGVLSSNGGMDFGSILGGMVELGYGFAYRVLDAQYCRVDGFARAVPQRRRRVFVVGHLGDWRRAAAVLFEQQSLSGNPAPRREAGKGIAPTISSRPTGGGGLGTDFDCDGGLIAADVASTLNAAFGDKQGLEDQHINSGAPLFVAHALRGEGFDASEDGTGMGAPIVPVTVDGRQDPIDDANSEVSPTLRAGGHADSHQNGGVMPTVAFQPRFARNDRGAPDTVAAPLTAEAGRTGKGDSAQCVAFSIMPMNSGKDYKARPTDVSQPIMAGGPVGGNQGGDYIANTYAVRRLTPTECERLQGFPDGYTAIPWRGKPADQCPDGPRYKALGNSMAVNVMRWIGQRIQMVEDMTND